MASIGIIANPQSGKDIRRLVSYATTIDNNEKVNICKRITLAAYGLGIEKAVYMPDTFTMGYSVQYQLEDDKMPCCEIEVLDFPFDASMIDTIEAARLMEERGVGCVVVLGGDGTSRAAAKSLKKTPMLSISTGTNNVYPQMMEGTVAGMAAAATALMDDPYDVCIHDKRIQVFVNGVYAHFIRHVRQQTADHQMPRVAAYEIRRTETVCCCQLIITRFAARHLCDVPHVFL